MLNEENAPLDGENTMSNGKLHYDEVFLNELPPFFASSNEIFLL